MEYETKRDENSELNYKRAKIFFERKVIVHCSLNNGKFYNGRIFSIQNDFFEIHDRITGLQVIFFSELTKPLQEYQEEK